MQESFRREAILELESRKTELKNSVEDAYAFFWILGVLMIMGAMIMFGVVYIAGDVLYGIMPSPEKTVFWKTTWSWAGIIALVIISCWIVYVGMLAFKKQSIMKKLWFLKTNAETYSEMFGKDTLEMKLSEMKLK